MSVPHQCGPLNRDCAERKTPVLYGDDYLRVARMGEGGPIQIRSVKRVGNGGWIVSYYGPEISFPQPSQTTDITNNTSPSCHQNNPS